MKCKGLCCIGRAMELLRDVLEMNRMVMNCSGNVR